MAPVSRTLSFALATLLVTGTATAHSSRSHHESHLVSDRLTLDLKNADLEDFLRLIAEVSGSNLVVDPVAQGKEITIKLQDVPWQQALDEVLRVHGLVAVQEGNVLRVAPVSKLIAEEQELAAYRQARQQSGELVTVARTLSNARAEDVLHVVEEGLTDRGSVIVDERTNTLIIKDVAGNLRTLLPTIGGFDPGVASSSASAPALRRPAPGAVVTLRLLEVPAHLADGHGLPWGGRARSSASLLAALETDSRVRLVDRRSVQVPVGHAAVVPFQQAGDRVHLDAAAAGDSAAELHVSLESNGGRPVVTYRVVPASSRTGRPVLAWFTPVQSRDVVDVSFAGPITSDVSRRLLLVVGPT